MVFLNRGTRFQAAPLPREAQFAPAFGIVAADFDNDGHEDVFLAQNFFATRDDLPRLDAGRGLVLKGTGDGRFTAVPGWEAGIQSYDEQRAAAVNDFDRDGRLDLVIGQFGAPTRLYRNTTSRSGLTVRLEGPPENPAAIGAVVRLVRGTTYGPPREIQAGSGYRSQNSLSPGLGGIERAEKIWVRWPGGRTTSSAIPPGAAEVNAGWREDP
jgi:hypothetical protein